ncbi:MAG: hypothetical protein J0H18_15850 [Rhizobiales bacterium]|nr:hypothetical protein [Hyphomicrobiales bacterium]
MTAHALAAEQPPLGLPPGVRLPKPLVSAPPPAPDPDGEPAPSWKHFRVGDTEVRISGSLRMDMATGHLHSSGR